MTCIHQLHLINQGVHWCELQKECYPDCDKCQDREEPPESVIEITDWLTRGISQKKFDKERAKAIRKAEKWYSKHSNLYYKGFRTQVHYSYKDRVYYGKIDNISDLVMYECDVLKDAKKEFHNAVNDYIKFKNKSNRRSL